MQTFNCEKLKNTLWERKLRQIDLSRSMNILPAKLNSWVTGRNSPSAAMLIKLAAALDVKPEYFFD